MGANIALDFAAHGFDVRLTDCDSLQLGKGRDLVGSNAKLMKRSGLLSERVASLLARISYVDNIRDAVDKASLVVESVPEQLELKRQVLADIEGWCPRQAVLASNTSTFVPSLLAADLRHPKRMLIMHYWNPAHLIPLVEVVPHPQTARGVLKHVRSVLRRCGKEPVVLRKEVAGFIGNRLAFAMQREAMDLVARGIATPAEIDLVASSSFGRRIPVSGIFATADLGGLDVYLAICESIFPDLCVSGKIPIALSQLVEQGRMGVKSGHGWSQYAPTRALALKNSVADELIRHAKRDKGGCVQARSIGPRGGAARKQI